jgi:hypothetical protein
VWLRSTRGWRRRGLVGGDGEAATSGLVGGLVGPPVGLYRGTGRNVGLSLRFSRDTSDTQSLGSPVKSAFMVPSSVPKSRIHALADMMQVNMSIHTIILDDYYYGHPLVGESVILVLETNRRRPHLLAIQKTLPHAYRAKALGRALLAVRTDPNRFWMLLSGNAEVAFPSTIATITAAASLPTSADVAPVVATAVATATASTTAASSIVASAAGQKRKACP